jgi:hypothetical protein
MPRILKALVRRRRAYRAVLDEDDEPVLDEHGNAEYTFDFEVWQQPEAGAADGSSGGRGCGGVVGSGGEPEKIRVFMRNHIAEQCQHIEPNDRVTITGAGVSFRAAPAAEEGAVSLYAIVSEPCVVNLQQVLPRSPGDASTQLAYAKDTSTWTFPPIGKSTHSGGSSDSSSDNNHGHSSGGSNASGGSALSGGAGRRGTRAAPRPQAPLPPEKRPRKSGGGAGGGGGGAGGGGGGTNKRKYQYTPLAQLTVGVGNFYGVVVNATFPRKTKNDYLAT